MTNKCLAACAALLIGVAACSEQASAPDAPGELLELDADLVSYGMVSYLTLNGVREGRIQADTAYLYRENSLASLRGMNVLFYDAEGREKASVTGVRGEWYQDSDRMVAQGDVVLIVHEDGSKLESAEIHYDPNAERIWSDSATVQTLADGTVTRGTAFESDLNFSNVRIENPRGGGRIVF